MVRGKSVVIHRLTAWLLLLFQDKCVDVDVFSKHCTACKMREKKKGSPEYDRWQAEHLCNINHTRSSGAMESAGAIRIFKRSVQKNNLNYHEYLGDGDTSSFKAVVDAKPYETYDICPVSLECVGHVQKRVGTRLRE